MRAWMRWTLAFAFFQLLEFDLPAHGPLVAAQSGLLFPEAMERRQERAVGEGSETGNTDIDANGGGRLRKRRFNLPLGLDADEPLASREADRGVAGLAQNLTGQPQAHPAELRQEDAPVGRVDLELLGIGVAEALLLSLFFEARKVGAFVEEIVVRPLQVFEGVLQGMDRGLFQPGRFCPIAPGGELLGL